MTGKTIVFDFGEVLFRTSAEELYRDRFRKQGRSEEELQHFLTSIFPDRERSHSNAGNLQDLIEEKARLHPEWADEIRAFGTEGEFPKFVRNIIPGMMDVLEELEQKGYRIVGLTNWHSDTYDILAGAFPEIMKHFDKVVVSGKIGMRKPDPEIFRHAQKEFGNPEASEVYYFDDKQRNTEAAQKTVGWKSFVFKGEETVRNALALTPKPF